MKVRNGFVSNSSTSSFLIFGTYLENSSEDIYQQFAGVEGIVVHSGPYDEDGVYVGRCPSTIRHDETGKQFKESTQKLIEEKLGREVKCDWMEHAWYNG